MYRSGRIEHGQEAIASLPTAGKCLLVWVQRIEPAIVPAASADGCHVG